MVKRRTLGEGLSPEEAAFLNPSEPIQHAPLKASATPEVTSVPVTPEVKPAPEPPPPAVQPQAMVFTPPTSMAGKMPLNTRLSNEVSTALLTASMQRKIHRHPVFTQQDIVGEAVSDWLKKNGFLPQ